MWASNDNCTCLRNLETEIKDISCKFNDLSSLIGKVKTQHSYADAVQSIYIGSSSATVNSFGYSCSAPPVNLVRSSTSCSLKSILFGLSESDTPVDLKKQVDDMSTYLVGSNVSLNHLDRLGRRYWILSLHLNILGLSFLP